MQRERLTKRMSASCGYSLESRQPVMNKTGNEVARKEKTDHASPDR